MKDFINNVIQQLNWVDVGVFAVLLFSLIVGLVRGFFTQIAGIVGVLAAIAVAYYGSPPVVDWVLDNWALTEKTAVILTFTTLFIATWAVWLLLSHLMKKLLTKMKFGTADRFLGGAFGLVKGALVAYVILVLIDGIVPALNDEIGTSMSNKGVARVDRLLWNQREKIPASAWRVISQLRKFPEAGTAPVAEEPPTNE